MHPIPLIPSNGPSGSIGAAPPPSSPPLKISLTLALALTLILGCPGSLAAEPTPLIPRTTLFQPALRSAPQISPDGRLVSWIAATNAASSLWIRTFEPGEPRQVALDAQGSLRQPTWQADSRALLFLQDTDPSGTPHLFQVHLASGNIRDLTPFLGVSARLVATSPARPHSLLATLNLRDRRLPELFRIDVFTGALVMEEENPGDITAWHPDALLQPRLAQIRQPDGHSSLSTRPDARSLWRPLLRWGPDEALGRFVAFGPTGSNAWILSSVGAPAPRLLDLHLAQGRTTVAARDPRYDVTDVLIHPASNTLQAVQFTRDRAQWLLLDPSLKPDFDALQAFDDADLDVVGRDLNDQRWTVALSYDHRPTQYALYDRATRTVTPLFDESPPPHPTPLAQTRPFQFTARDGLPLEGYLTLPTGLDPRGLPAVLLVHGGPWARTIWGYDPEVQWLANRGYAVLQVNFRGSTGYGKPHLQAGDREWGGTMLLDLIDTKRWAAQQGLIDPSRTALMGTGFGGYATLAALALHPGEFAAGVSLSGAPSLITLIAALPPGSSPLRSLLQQRLGDPEKDRPRLLAHSPITHVRQLRDPLLVVATGNDPQAPITELDAFVAALRRDNRTVEYLLFPQESGLLRLPLHRRRFHAAAEAFLARHLGGRAQPPTDPERFDSHKR